MAQRYEAHVSISEPGLLIFLDNHPNLSPSMVFRDAIVELKRQEDMQTAGNVALLQKRLAILQTTIKEQSEFISENGLDDKWAKKFQEQGMPEIKPLEIQQ